MTVTALISALICTAPIAAVIVVFWKLGSGRTPLPATTTWIDEFSVERYRPMLRLLDGAEIRFIRSHSSADSGFIAQFWRERCRILQQYLASLTTDFTRVLAALKLVMTQASRDRPDLAALLIRSQATFAVCMVLAHVQMQLYRFGIGTVNIGELLNVFEAMRRELRTLVPRVVGPAA